MTDQFISQIEDSNMGSLKNQFDKDVIGKDNFGNDINSLGQTFASYTDYVATCEEHDTILGESKEFPLKTCKGLWFPIGELKNKYIETPILIASPKLVDLDSNPEGISTAHWQDDEGWIANGWDMNNDEHVKVVLTEEDVTHFLYVEGPYRKCENGDVSCE